MSMSSEVILICAYTPTVEKLDNLREAIKTIKSFNYEVCLATHSSTPQDIVDRCDYYIYDKKNQLNYDPDIAYWIIHETPIFKVYYKQYGGMSTHIVPIMRLMFGGLTYLKSLGVKKVHIIEYDTVIHNDDIFKHMSKQIDEDVLSCFYSSELNNKDIYSISLIGINLDKLDPTLVPTDETELINLYREYFNQNIFPVTERIIYDKLWSKYPIKWNALEIAEKSLTFETSRGTNGYGDNSYLLHVHDGILHLFSSNNTDEEWVFDIIINNTNYKNGVSPKTWRWIPLRENDGIETIKLILNNKVIKNFDMSKKEDYDLIHKWVILHPTNF